MREYIVHGGDGVWWRFSTYAPSANIPKPRVKVMTQKGEQLFVQRSTAAEVIMQARRWGWKVEKVA